MKLLPDSRYDKYHYDIAKINKILAEDISGNTELLHKLQIKLDRLSDLYQQDESLGPDRYGLYQAQALIHYYSGNTDEAIIWMQNAVKVKGESYKLADNFLKKFTSPEKTKTELNRINRSTYLLSFIISIVIYFSIIVISGLLLGIFASDAVKDNDDTYEVLSTLGMIPSLVYILYTSRLRIHDLNTSGWWLILSFVPVINLFLLLQLILSSGVNMNNKYGAPPSGTFVVGFKRT